jgi:HlyD family secretion protein
MRVSWRLLLIIPPVVLIAFIAYGPTFHRKSVCFFPRPTTVSTVSQGPFVESIPVVGKFTSDSVVEADIYQMYVGQVKVGLNASTQFKDQIYNMKIDEVDTTSPGGRFRARLSFHDSIPPIFQNVLLRIYLSETIDAIRLPVGGFYKDTGGKWVLVVNGNNVVRREIKLGRKSPDYLEVLEGLNPGERAITSSYENYLAHFDLSKQIDLEALTSVDK